MNAPATLCRPEPVSVAADVDRQSFITAMGKACTGVSIVTTNGPGGRLGATVSAMSSVSADPPMLLVCINRNNLVAPALNQNQHFCVNVLSARHTHLSQVFAGQAPARDSDRFACADWLPSESGAPVLAGALAAFECKVMHQVDLGTHTVFVGQVLRSSHQDGAPLLYHHRQYCQPQPLAD